MPAAMRAAPKAPKAAMKAMKAVEAAILEVRLLTFLGSMNDQSSYQFVLGESMFVCGIL